MATPAYQVPQLTPVQFAQRMAALFPNGWSSNDAKSPGGVLFGVFQALGENMTYELDTSLTYADDAISILTGQNGALDLASLDFFGATGLYALPRSFNESDAAYSARIEAALFPTGATRSAVAAALEKLLGNNFRIIEPWSPADNGVIDGVAGAGMIFLDVDTIQTPGQVSDPSLAYQGFIQAILPYVHPLGPNPMPCMDNAGAIFGGCIYLDVPGSSMFDFYDSITLGAESVYNVINRTKCEGTIAWVQFVSSLSVESVPGPIAEQLLSGLPVDLGFVTDPFSVADDFGILPAATTLTLYLGTVP